MASSSQSRRSRREALEAQRLAQARKQRRNKIVGVAVGVVVLVVVIGLAIWGIIAATNKGGNEVPPNANSGKNGIWLAPPTDGAPTLEIFSDYNCPNCKTAELTMTQTMDDLASAGKINLMVHSLQFEHASSHLAAVGAACADYAGKFADYNLQLFLNQSTDGSGFTSTMLRETIPAAIGLTGTDLTTFQTCLDNQATGNFVDDEAAYAAKQKVSSTPQFRLDGKDITSQIYNTSTKSFDVDLLRSVVENAG